MMMSRISCGRSRSVGVTRTADADSSGWFYSKDGDGSCIESPGPMRSVEGE